MVANGKFANFYIYEKYDKRFKVWEKKNKKKMSEKNDFEAIKNYF